MVDLENYSQIDRAWPSVSSENPVVEPYKVARGLKITLY
jgi:hypothetical protein